MAKLLWFVALVVVVEAAHVHHSKFRKGTDEYESSAYKKVPCSNDHDRERNEIMNKSSCGAPKEVFVHLAPQATYEQVSPSAVWVKRCVGLCDHAAYGSRCMPTKIVHRNIPVRIYNAKTNKATCSTYRVEEHEACGCCSASGEKCEENRVFNPRKCSCQCPNMEERRSCLRKRNQNLRWNRSKCACEPRRRALK
ncbi:uncharacterized protein LOC135073522 isoform X1 [Ostrinia nubilalis]|uniref:uncharacterized protein LOC135073522 isoform X1 n=1 Tax=Ostrinia nubilalis TaxID=29057 RepID=UPI003082279F